MARGIQTASRPLPGSTRLLVLAALFAALTGVLAYVRVPLPFSPVPITGQTFGLMLAGLLLGARWGAVSQAVYVMLGAVGLPIYAGGQAGLGVLFGPTGGYLFGHILGAYVVGFVAVNAIGSRFNRFLAASAAGGIVAVYALGIPQLAIVTGMGWREALVAGGVPFLLGDGVKALAAAAIAARVAGAVRNLPGR